MRVSGRLADSNGNAVNDDRIFSKRVIPTTNPDWGGSEININSGNDIGRSSFIGLKIHNGLSTYPQSLGYALIPITDFTENEIVKELDIISLKLKPLDGNPGNKYILSNRTKIKFYGIIRVWWLTRSWYIKSKN